MDYKRLWHTAVATLTNTLDFSSEDLKRMESLGFEYPEEWKNEKKTDF